jgi:ABC-type phosphate transport system substrate-binding protein
MRRVLGAIAALGISVAAAGAAAAESPNDILVIANNSVPVKSVTVAELQEFFLKDRVYWSGTTKAVPVNAPEGSALRTEFRKRVLQMTANAEKQFWQTRKIKVGVTEPPQFENSMKAVFKLAGAVGYVFRSQYKEGVAKVLLVLPAQ